MAENHIKNIQDIMKQYDVLQDQIREMNEEEKRLKKELEKIREHLSYYTALVKDMKKRMRDNEELDVFHKV